MTKSDWQSYEAIATFVLNQCAHEFGLARFDGKQDVPGNSGTSWEVDARGWSEGNTSHFLVECKNHEGTRINQAITGSLAYQILDTNAEGGFLVSPCGLQSGAKHVADASNIVEIKLDPRSTTDAYFGEWLGMLRAGFGQEAVVSIREHLLITAVDERGNESVLCNTSRGNPAADR